MNRDAAPISRETAQALAAMLGCKVDERFYGGQLFPSVLGNMASFSRVLKTQGGRWRTALGGYTFETWQELVGALTIAKEASERLSPTRIT
jgi:hypothetical protein